MKPEKYINSQMGLFDEWECSQTVKGTDVFSSGNGRVRRKWLSRCGKERALTQDLMSEIAGLKNLETALRKVISNKGRAGTDGMGVQESWTTAGSSKGWFNLSITPAAHEGMNLKWFKQRGLYSLTANYG